jgi:hypothetical protein
MEPISFSRSGLVVLEGIVDARESKADEEEKESGRSTERMGEDAKGARGGRRSA